MAYEFRAALICDGCGKRVEIYPQTRPSETINLGKKVLRRAVAAGWEERKPEVYSKAHHYCNYCRTIPKPEDLPAINALLAKLKKGEVKV